MSRRVVVTGLGCISPLGNSVRESWLNLLNSKSGLVNLKSLPEYESDYKPFIKSVPESLSVGKAYFTTTHKDLFSDEDERRLAKFTKYAIGATYEALENANLLKKNTLQIDETLVDLNRFGCIVGSGIASIDEIYTSSIKFHNEHKRVNPLFIPKILTNMAAGNISIKFKLKGPSHSVSTACATGNNAIGDAYNFIKLGMQDICVAGAAEASLHPLSLAGFVRAKSITSNGISRPFDEERSGFVLGEGAGIVVLESLENALKRGANIICEIIGYGISSDANHITSPLPDGTGAQRAIEMAIGNSRRSEIKYVNAHATSTVLGDRAESNAIRNAIFKDTDNDNHIKNEIYVSSNKGSMGHLLGAAGAVESIFTIKSIQKNIIPHTLNLNKLDQEIQESSEGMTFVKESPKEIDNLEMALCNSFGFGGINTTLLYKKYRP
ncbi:hypothetical protein Kpol_1066p49 [Vanderwaltozyma polyspora DSM 70294]|uniref:beta-ketoacyl-[acyl-carrier-protein] synthase I n=1 Tax=Vanderwaltozyma polyspora (strain ATCC 22028 / DSM 70294 / BCRC 21397 / CBS 2163 / NBRC 10782 / NRRL Y-8283 / UCD 57-17) TaxID=436907 RepID=A7TMR7_VANPO|nr:uncharacterized protein Kpol_1066p49 [Vanderwaltozyma polyspora DSM 70294]EDO16481.1 hypothetical protein Kpol_1066p49 [Vanderwaltozyma polyspora DSM 70294]